VYLVVNIYSIKYNMYSIFYSITHKTIHICIVFVYNIFGEIMTKDKMRYGTVVVYITTIVLALFLVGQIVLVTLYGHDGIILDLGIHGYPDYIALSQVVSKDTPTINQAYAPTTENNDKLIDSIRESSLVIYTDTEEMVLAFVTGRLQFWPASNIHGSVSLDGGMLASMYAWIDEHMTEVESVLGYTLDSRVELESVVVSKATSGVHMQYIVSIDKVALLSELEISSKYKENLSNLLKLDKLYFTLACDGVIDSGKVASIEDFSMSLSDANPSMSEVLSDYIEDKSQGMFESVIVKYMTALNGLGQLSVGYDRLIVKN
jgi:hypothetical protein